jgi:hypothetical protein
MRFGIGRAGTYLIVPAINDGAIKNQKWIEKLFKET